MSKDLSVKIVAAYKAAELVRAGFPCIVITSYSKYDWMNEYSNACLVKFADTEIKNHPDAVKTSHVRDIAAFLEKSKSNEMVVACDEGVSRSSATAAAILSLCGCDDDWIWKSAEYRPNVLVYKTVLEYYMPFIPAVDKLKATQFRSPEAYRYYRKHGVDPTLPDYERIIERNVGGKDIQYGFAYGNDKSRVLFIKTGGGGDIYGADNKYLKAASFIREQQDITVVVSSNPYDGSDALADAEEVIRRYFAETGIQEEQEEEVFYFGYSDGARLAADYGLKHDIFTSYLMYNLPVGAEETEEMIEKLTEIGRKHLLILVFGEEDESYKASEDSLRSVATSLEMHILKGAEHSLTAVQAMVLPELFFRIDALKENGIDEIR